MQWDLTLYLGANLPEKGGADARLTPLYEEARVATLTQLPWLREGHMPNWLRRALIDELAPGRAREVRRALQRLIKNAELSGNRITDEAVQLRISREASKEHLAPEELYDDEVLLGLSCQGRRRRFQARQ